jgi:hypothetical protein
MMLVAVAVPSGKTWQPGMGVSFASMCALSARNGIGIGILCVEGTWVANARINLALQAIANNTDYILFVDDDMVFPPDSLHRMLEHQKDVVGVLYSQRSHPYRQVGVLEGVVSDDEIDEGGLAEAETLGTGLILIRTSVFARIKEPWFLWTETHSDDAYFIEKVKKAKIKVWCDLGLSKEVGHIGSHVFRLRNGHDKQNRVDSR